ncbi:MAG: ABC transporter permease subunit [Erysipelotrichaceae bacterium]|jgi:glutathione transport system permease protein|nr:ABC transporter permease subunit [Erysipelotrichaceae bacterium]
MSTKNEKAKSSRFNDFLRKFKKQKSAIAALIVLLILVFIAIFCYQIAPYGINEFDYSSVLQKPSAAHWFGTDEFGRDLFSRILCGTRISLTVGLAAVTVGAISGTVLGLIAGYYGGIAESLIMRMCDVLFAFPGIILAIAIIAILGSGMTNVVIAVAVFSMPTFCRLVRSTVLATKESVYVQAERSLGASDARILFRHILPAALPNIIVQYTMSIGNSIMTASSLSFLGMGAQAPTPEWGLILSTGRTYMVNAVHMMLFPGLAIFITVLCFNLLGDGLRDALDPKLSE